MSTHRSSLANMENGRRAGITVAEWLAFAYVLDVPPLALLFPQLPDGAVEPLPGVSLDRTSAVSWLATGRLSGDTDSAYHDAVREAFRAMERDRAARVRLAEAALDA